MLFGMFERGAVSETPSPFSWKPIVELAWCQQYASNVCKFPMNWSVLSKAVLPKTQTVAHLFEDAPLGHNAYRTNSHRSKSLITRSEIADHMFHSTLSCHLTMQWQKRDNGWWFRAT
jgi:hypothetical protein